ncbi:WhiB family transcriptional regulator [Microbacterium sp. zg-YB36]|uniref:WhiB family transcriptional regulator n=1 Tax=Microbacterium sp. zg-YB36 TaxID=2969407 RepID=UPI00214B1853|nr:WhiB family transcriptional regulator [Microbacterium sp. zg-YB36]MDL5351132.1 WhiB family transcriptional regulator [Microbacterium sp. zg-YB36]
MNLAHIGEGPQPDCWEHSDEFSDYEMADMPDRETAELLCSRCPLLQVCAANARHRKPAWGVFGGVAYVNGRQAHLLAEDDPRLQEAA